MCAGAHIKHIGFIHTVQPAAIGKRLSVTNANMLGGIDEWSQVIDSSIPRY